MKISMKLPKLESRKVWIGTYGGHGYFVVVFKKRPKKTKGSFDSTLENEVCAIISTGDWELFFDLQPLIDAGLLRENGAAFHVDVRKVIPMELEAPWDGDEIAGLNCNSGY